MRRRTWWPRNAKSRRNRRKAPAEGKPAEILAKIVEGRLRKSINEFALTGQVFVKDGDLTIEKLLQKNKASVKASSASKSAPASKRSRTTSLAKSWRR